MESMTRATNRVKVSKARCLNWTASGGKVVLGILTVKQGGTSTMYVVSRVAADFGLGFAVRKVGEDGQTYHANLAIHGGHHSCDCAHGCYRPWAKPCRHLAALALLHRLGKV
jgi:hypothetical protein